MTIGIYAIRNTVNGKVYIGSSQNIEVRWRRHRNDLCGDRHHSVHLNRAWNLDGADAFSFEVLVECSKEHLTMYEQLILDFYKAGDAEHGYNSSAVAGSRAGVKHSEATKQKQRERALARAPMSEETKRKLSEAQKLAIAEGRTFTAEHRRKLSLSQIGKVVTDETRKRIGEASRRAYQRKVKEETTWH